MAIICRPLDGLRYEFRESRSVRRVSAVAQIDWHLYRRTGQLLPFDLHRCTCSSPYTSSKHVDMEDFADRQVAILSTYFLTLLTDVFESRYFVNIVMFSAVFVSSIILLVWDVSTSAHWFAYIIGGLGYAGQASNFAWANVMTMDDEVLRSFTLFGMNMGNNLCKSTRQGRAAVNRYTSFGPEYLDGERDLRFDV